MPGQPAGLAGVWDLFSGGGGTAAYAGTSDAGGGGEDGAAAAAERERVSPSGRTPPYKRVD